MSRLDYRAIADSLSIEEVARRLGMELRTEAPDRFKALCPFHDDKTPSLLIDANRDRGRQHFYCFACGASGDVIDLTKGVLHVGFKDAIDWLSPGANNKDFLKLRSKKKPDADTAKELHTSLELGYSIYKKKNLDASFLTWAKSRNLNEQVLRQAGFVFAEENLLSKYLESTSDTNVRRERAEALEEAHLIRKLIPGVSTAFHLPLHAGPQYRDSFLNTRVVFPLFDEKRKLVGLGSRAVDDGDIRPAPKYQFTKGFPKGSVLYRAESAFAQIRSASKDGKDRLGIYVCEGFLDALRIEACGLPAVAVMGSSISESQIRLLVNLADTLPKKSTLAVHICFDRDEAGLRGAADACLKLMNALSLECSFVWPTSSALKQTTLSGSEKDPNEYLASYAPAQALQILTEGTHSPLIAIISYAFGSTAEDVLDNEYWKNSPRSRKLRAFSKAYAQLKKLKINSADFSSTNAESSDLLALREWDVFISTLTANPKKALSEDFLHDASARLNHARILAYMGSQRGELPCDEPRWERLDIAATAFNTLLVDRLNEEHATPIGTHDAVWVPRSFGGPEYRLKMMPCAEDLIIQQYLLNEILTERWDLLSFSDLTFSSSIPAVRFYREAGKTITSGFEKDGNGNYSELHERTLSFAYQVDMDVLEGRQPASDQGMYRPFAECWRDFMTSVSEQANDIGYVYSMRLDVKRYYDRIRRYVVRDRLLQRLKRAFESVTDNTPDFAPLLNLRDDDALSKAASFLDVLGEQIFGVNYNDPDTGEEKITDAFTGIPQGPVLSAWIGSIALFPVDEEAHRLILRHNTDRVRIGYARYVDDIVLLADSQSRLSEMREVIDQCVRNLELTLIAKADEIPPMSARDFVAYINQGRALAAYVPAWEPPLIGDGESGWGFWAVSPTTNRQSALHLLHNVDLYKASAQLLLQTVQTAFQAVDLRTSELPKGARLIWYSLAIELSESVSPDSTDIWEQYLNKWDFCLQRTPWAIQPENNMWESPALFALEGLEHLLDKKSRDIPQLSAAENYQRRKRITWLANCVLSSHFESSAKKIGRSPLRQLERRFKLLHWKASRITGQPDNEKLRLPSERSKLFSEWRPFEWLHEAIFLLGNGPQNGRDPLTPLQEQTWQLVKGKSPVTSTNKLILSLLADTNPTQGEPAATNQTDALIEGIALQTLVSVIPREHLLTCLNQRGNLLWGIDQEGHRQHLVIPPLPGITAKRLFCCAIAKLDGSPLAEVQKISAVEITPSSDPDNLTSPLFIGVGNSANVGYLPLSWQDQKIRGTNDLMRRLDAPLKEEEYIQILECIPALEQNVTASVLRRTAKIFRAIAQVVLAHSHVNEDEELVPAWPYIATSADSETYYLITEGVSRDELGSRAFVRDGGRALRTVEVSIYEANLWRVGIAVTDFLGLYDDVAKFSSWESDFDLNSNTLSNPARYVLRAQLRKLRGAYANSRIARSHPTDSHLPATIERSLQLLETFPDDDQSTLRPLLHVLAIETESAAMYLALRERASDLDICSFFYALINKVVGRLPLSIAKNLAWQGDLDNELRRDFGGILSFARRLFAASSMVNGELIAWRALLAATVSTGISVAVDGVLASLRSHGSFEKYDHFDFPASWEIPASVRPPKDTDGSKNNSSTKPKGSNVERLRVLFQHLGHRVSEDSRSPDKLSDGLIEQFHQLAKSLAQSEYPEKKAEYDWPFAALNTEALAILNLDVLERLAELVKQLDAELGLKVTLAQGYSYGFNANTSRFTDSRNGVTAVTPWMISQFPVASRNIEEVLDNGRYLKIWSECFDQKTGRLLSVSVLGEPFASIAIEKSILPVEDNGPKGINSALKNNHKVEVHEVDNLTTAPSPNEPQEPKSVSNPPEADSSSNRVSKSNIHRWAHSFQNNQRAAWGARAKNSAKDNGHVRVALLQTEIDLTYLHPMVEACPSNWPFGKSNKGKVTEKLRSSASYSTLLRAAESTDSAHLWDNIACNEKDYPSWAEHRRRRILKQVIASCEALAVDLLVLPEYSIRPETVEWLKQELTGKHLSVLAGTHLEFKREPQVDHLRAKLSLLWPVPKDVLGSLNDSEDSPDKRFDLLERGAVLEFVRGKKYRSIALEEFFRPASTALSPLFRPYDLPNKLESAIGRKLPTDAISHLLTQTRLPLKHLLELICSEVFLVSSPANYLHMSEDYQNLRAKFGEPGDSEEVHRDVRELARLLSITGDGKSPRRSILAVPAATSRSADYWIAGQTNFLAAGTTSVFCNSIGSKDLVGGSCFIGRGSWKTEKSTAGYIPRITPYHGWSKGIFYNSNQDALSDKDQALVVADIDPHNMMEGKPRAQTMPSPLQLVAYLPIIETIDWEVTEKNLLSALSIPSQGYNFSADDKRNSRAIKEEDFWKRVLEACTKLDTHSFMSLWDQFPDEAALIKRYKACQNNDDMQPTSSRGKGSIFNAPALYDWIDVSLTVNSQQSIPSIEVPHWKRR